MKSFLKNSSLQLKVGLLLLCVVLAMAILPLFSQIDPSNWDTYIKNLKPSAEHLLGTNSLGQDIFWLLAKAVQNSLIIGVITSVLATIIGIFLGMLAGFRGGFIDRVLCIIMDTFIVIPSLPILILIASLLKGRATVLDISMVLVLFSWPWVARRVRSMVLSIRERDFIDTARFSGERQIKIMAKEVLPFIVSYSISGFINTILVAIRTESTLAVIGLSNNSWATLGTMIYWAKEYQSLLLGRWIWIGTPVIATVIIFVGLFMTLSGAQKYNALKRGKEV